MQDTSLTTLPAAPAQPWSDGGGTGAGLTPHMSPSCLSVKGHNAKWRISLPSGRPQPSSDILYWYRVRLGRQLLIFQNANCKKKSKQKIQFWLVRNWEKLSELYNLGHLSIFTWQVCGFRNKSHKKQSTLVTGIGLKLLWVFRLKLNLPTLQQKISFFNTLSQYFVITCAI